MIQKPAVKFNMKSIKRLKLKTNGLFTEVDIQTNLTTVAVVVHQDDFLKQVGRSPLDGRVDGAQQHR